MQASELHASGTSIDSSFTPDSRFTFDLSKVMRPEFERYLQRLVAPEPYSLRKSRC